LPDQEVGPDRLDARRCSAPRLKRGARRGFDSAEARGDRGGCPRDADRTCRTNRVGRGVEDHLVLHARTGFKAGVHERAMEYGRVVLMAPGIMLAL